MYFHIFLLFVEFVHLQIHFIFEKYSCEFTNLILYLWEVFYIHRLHIYTHIVDLLTQIILRNTGIMLSKHIMLQTKWRRVHY